MLVLMVYILTSLMPLNISKIRQRSKRSMQTDKSQPYKKKQMYKQKIEVKKTIDHRRGISTSKITLTNKLNRLASIKLQLEISNVMKKITKASLIFLLGILMQTSTIISAQDGALDADFDGDGMVPVTATSESSRDNAQDIIVQADSKIVVVGYSDKGTDIDVAIVRLHPDGSLDNSFSVDGRTTLDLGSNEHGYSVALQTDQKILIGGTALGMDGVQFLIIRYNADGTLDNSFGINGHITTDFTGGNNQARKIHYLAEGKILITGYSFNGVDSDFAAAQYNADGTPDLTYGVDGKIRIDIHNGDQSESSLIQEDGKLILWGHTSPGPKTDFAVIRLNIDGTLDDSFGDKGIVITPFSDGNEYAYSVVLQPDGKIVGVGYSESDVDQLLAVVRYHPDGSLDNSFGTNGQASHFVGDSYDNPNAATIQSDGKIVVTGTTSGDSGDDATLVRLLSNGSLDNTFGDNGIVITDFFGFSNQSTGITIQPDLRILVCGFVSSTFNRDFLIARYLSGLNVGILDFSVTNRDMNVYPNPIQEQTVLEYTLIKDEVLTIVLYDLSGRIVQTVISKEKRRKGINKEPIVFQNTIPSGPYVLTISNGAERRSIHVIK